LMAACKYGHIECVKLLYSEGADINNANKNDETPLLVAVRHQKSDIAALLAAKTTDINYENKFDNLTPFMRAALHGDYKTA
jgi:ankyrin repeat protein